MKIILIGEDGKRVGEVTMREAERQANLAGKNLNMVAPNVYRIADTGKLKYERNQKQKLQKAKRRQHKVKEIKFGIKTDKHDLEVKSRRIRQFLSKGLRTKVTLQFKGRQMAFKNVGFQKIRDLIMPLVEEGLASLDREPKLEGYKLVAFLVPSKQ